MANPYYSVEQAAEVLGVCTKWFYQQLNRGNIPGAFRIGKSPWFIDRDLFHEGLKELASKPPKPKRPRSNSKHGL